MRQVGQLREVGAVLEGQTIVDRLQEDLEFAAIVGGGTANTAFLQGGSGGPNAMASLVTAVFWIEEVAGTGGQPDFVQIQYSQTVFLDFNGVRWPHVSVATLRKEAPAIS